MRLLDRAPGRGLGGTASTIRGCGTGARRSTPSELWRAHLELKRVLVRLHPRGRAAPLRRPAGGRRRTSWAPGTLLDPDALTIGFARRFATYKRANLIFQRPRAAAPAAGQPATARCRSSSPGKAHPGRHAGQGSAAERLPLHPRSRASRDASRSSRTTTCTSRTCWCRASIVWLNLPRVPLEASRHQRHEGGAQRRAPAQHPRRLVAGGLRWTSGWAIPPARERGRAATRRTPIACYRLLEEQVVPLYYTRDAQGIPLGWVRADAARAPGGGQPLHRPAHGAGLRPSVLRARHPRRSLGRRSTHCVRQS